MSDTHKLKPEWSLSTSSNLANLSHTRNDCDNSTAIQMKMAQGRVTHTYPEPKHGSDHCPYFAGQYCYSDK